MNQLSFTITNDSVVVIDQGKPVVVRKGAPNFAMLKQALVAGDWDAARQRLTVAKALQGWANGKFKLENNVVSFNGEALPAELNKRITEMASNGEDPTRFCLFWERLQKNPSRRSVEQLWAFLNQVGIPLTKEGKFLAYKGVRDDYKDAHSGTVDNTPGVVNEMPRNKISDDPNEACHFGFHVGALEYAQNFSQRVVICEVDPEDVVCVPYDHSHQKMRVSKYKVIGNHNGQYLSSTSYDEDLLQDQLDDGFLPDELDDDDSYDLVHTTFGGPNEKGDELPVLGDSTKKYGAKRPRTTASKNFERLDTRTSAELLDETMNNLRAYASNHLKIVGASKIPGGKVAIIRAINKVRRKV